MAEMTFTRVNAPTPQFTGVILLIKERPEYLEARKLTLGPTLHLGKIFYPTIGLAPS